MIENDLTFLNKSVPFFIDSAHKNCNYMPCNSFYGRMNRFDQFQINRG